MNTLADLDGGAFLDAVADRIAQRIAIQLTKPQDDLDRWLTTREAAKHLGMHPDSLRKLATARAIPSEQEAPGCAWHFGFPSWTAGASPAVRVVRPSIQWLPRGFHVLERSYDCWRFSIIACSTSRRSIAPHFPRKRRRMWATSNKCPRAAGTAGGVAQGELAP
jgi:hypothetical protein